MATQIVTCIQTYAKTFKNKKKKKKKKENLPMIVVTYFILDLVRAEMEKGMYLTLSIKGCDDVNICRN